MRVSPIRVPEARVKASEEERSECPAATLVYRDSHAAYNETDDQDFGKGGTDLEAAPPGAKTKP